MLILPSSVRNNLKDNDVTPESLFYSRRKFIKSAGLLGSALIYSRNSYSSQANSAKFANLAQTHNIKEELTPFHDVTHYNNFYELGTGKADPAANARALQTSPWSIEVTGHCNKPGKLILEDILKPHTYEERIYRFRCVEAWSMVIPWAGFPLSSLLKRFEPTSKAKYVAFETIYDKKNPLPGQKRPTIRWPYREGLRIDEAMHPLTFMATGIYGKPLLNQNGAPLRLVVPWKYGFKSIKSIVKISFTEKQPPTSWNTLASREYGFYSNVNPEVSHPRWSQARERRIGELFKRKTLMFNGYEEQVASLYSGMNLKKYY
ncbi:MAG: protein-methionine-sulfoxide reductase catalytic subunit MsrP [Cellvibrionaceae bacterium]|nr:protein-methionine-sulfoxide reductase catalytic subunit MsrP [Cellvibrionaceae bacterium]